MNARTTQQTGSGEKLWEELVAQLSLLLEDGDHTITLLANTAAFLYEKIGRLNWAGFYLYDGKELILGPFCGKPACTRIGIGKGVCGTAAERKETIVVPDVDNFPGHIACDGNSRSEIVLPLLANDGSLLGVMDLDSPELARFGEDDRRGLEALRDILMQRIAPKTDWFSRL